MAEALRLADEWLRKTRSEADRRNSAYDHYGMGNTPENVDPLGAKMVAELRRLHSENERLQERRDALLEALKSTGLFLHHCWCDVQMNEYSFEKLNQQMAVVDAAIALVEGRVKAVEEGK